MLTIHTFVLKEKNDKNISKQTRHDILIQFLDHLRWIFNQTRNEPNEREIKIRLFSKKHTYQQESENLLRPTKHKYFDYNKYYVKKKCSVSRKARI